MHPLTETLHLTTHIACPVGEVWSAFADTDVRQQWSVPAGEGLNYDYDDFRTGGSARYRCGTPGELQFSAAIDYVRVEEQSYAVHTDTVWRDEDLLATALITWTFSAVPEGTRVSIVDQVVSFVGTGMIDGHRNGHRIALEQLGVFLTSPGEVGTGATHRDGSPS
ncbi:MULTISPECIES: SRPBCC domain-containing protein [Brevibacterium]|uniref:Uncharacterized conserved protein YndB, AHSA1/START domain n=1 Tax=Brevibacterium antiquum CNRZ 918 TaxID=1255637 RepID=A0A2H1K7V8_9MICO|nr:MULTISPECIES: SRPBCC domain-containing protein [Brevibacterium]SMX95897.1 Uncharacterized conserved protein YndB, AHSA1/START domain [Brevibacterium antiquum CNRZ 918]HCG55875.1 hypothetical protein [Brevibacterium sp.]